MTTIRIRIKQHFCIPCQAWTCFEREADLPADCQSGDPDYEDRSKCGLCGEVYQCGECGVEWNVEREECQAVLDHGSHGPEEEN